MLHLLSRAIKASRPKTKGEALRRTRYSCLSTSTSEYSIRNLMKKEPDKFKGMPQELQHEELVKVYNDTKVAGTPSHLVLPTIHVQRSRAPFRSSSHPFALSLFLF